MWKRVFPRLDKDWMMMKVSFLYLDKARIVPKPGPREKKIWVAAAIHTWKKFNTLVTKGKVSCSFPWIKVRVLSICLWSVFLGWTIGVCSVGGQVSISFLVLILSEWWILVCSTGHWASVASFSEVHRSLAYRVCLLTPEYKFTGLVVYLLQLQWITHFFICSINFWFATMICLLLQ